MSERKYIYMETGSEPVPGWRMRRKIERQMLGDNGSHGSHLAGSLMAASAVFLLGSIALLLAKATTAPRQDRHLLPHDHVRDAGPESMSNPPRNWHPVDEMSDESFPASDPPGTY